MNVPEEDDDDDDEGLMTITPLGHQNNIMALGERKSRTQRRRAQRSRCLQGSIQSNDTPIHHNYNSHNSQTIPHVQAPRLSKRKALDMYQNELVASPNIPVHNQFSTLRVVRKNSPKAQIRSIHDIPKPRGYNAPNSQPITQYQAANSGREVYWSQHQAANPGRAVYQAYRQVKARRSQTTQDLR